MAKVGQKGIRFEKTFCFFLVREVFGIKTTNEKENSAKRFLNITKYVNSFFRNWRGGCFFREGVWIAAEQTLSTHRDFSPSFHTVDPAATSSSFRLLLVRCFIYSISTYSFVYIYGRVYTWVKARKKTISNWKTENFFNDVLCTLFGKSCSWTRTWSLVVAKNLTMKNKSTLNVFFSTNVHTYIYTYIHTFYSRNDDGRQLKC